MVTEYNFVIINCCFVLSHYRSTRFLGYKDPTARHKRALQTAHNHLIAY